MSRKSVDTIEKNTSKLVTWPSLWVLSFKDCKVIALQSYEIPETRALCPPAVNFPNFVNYLSAMSLKHGRFTNYKVFSPAVLIDFRFSAIFEGLKNCTGRLYINNMHTYHQSCRNCMHNEVFGNILSMKVCLNNLTYLAFQPLILHVRRHIPGVWRKCAVFHEITTNI
jgi:hypothetical protein